jgi:succinate dehydrogenase hydrophobic anchor subunit
MATPYVTSRTGSAQWLLQRVSAVLLVGLAFLHFGMQHFTSDAVSSGLTVAARANNPWWQAYYVAFVVLALYHGINGVVGIVRDFKPRPLTRGLVELALWTIAACFAVLGIRNFINPTPLGAVKEYYATNGLPVGASVGHPPGVLGEIRYDFRDELRELHLLNHYLVKHTAGGEAVASTRVFGDQAGGGASPEQVRAAGATFDAWCLAEAAKPAPAVESRERSLIFSSLHEFAIWAGHVRQADAAGRATNPEHPDAQPVLDRYRDFPSYRAVELH